MTDDLARQRLERLAARAAGGDRVALDDVLRTIYPQVRAITIRVVGNRGDADDAAQVALTKIAQSISKFRGDSRFTTWVHRISTNAALDELRRATRRATPAVVVDDIDGRDDPNLGAVELSLDISQALDDLPVEFRTAVVLRDVGDLDYDEISEILDCPIGTVKSRIARGRAQLAEILRPGNRGHATDVKGDDHV